MKGMTALNALPPATGLTTDHIVSAFDEELARLTATISRMGGIAESQVAAAIEALSRRNPSLAAKVVQNDARVDQMEEAIDDMAVRLLALRQPMAGDLRAVVSAIKIASDLERIADHAKNIAKRSVDLSRMPDVDATRTIVRLGRLVQHMMTDVLDAYANGSDQLAKSVWRSDDDVDALHDSLVRALLTYMMADPQAISPCAHLLFVAKNFERIGDHITNIAETIYYLTRGDRLSRHPPPGGSGGAADSAGTPATPAPSPRARAPDGVAVNGPLTEDR